MAAMGSSTDSRTASCRLTARGLVRIRDVIVIRCGMVATFGGMWREVVAVSIALV
jgi:hypothetical protein